MPYKDINKQREAQREYMRRNRDKYYPKVKDHKRKIRDWFDELKRTLSCKNCGESHPGCLDFHHKDESTKYASISVLASCGYSKDKILQEIAKCEVLCSNCHRKLHYDECGTNKGFKPVKKNKISKRSTRITGRAVLV